MYNNVITLTEFILQEERKFKNAKGSFTILLTHIENAAKIIASHIKASGLVDIFGKTGSINSFGEEVQKLDMFANTLLCDMLLGSHEVFAVGSEELSQIMYAPHKKGEYVVFFDPLDGSSNIETNNSIGTIFSIYHKSSHPFQPGNKQIAAGYIIYGPSVIFVYCAGASVNGFTLDPSIGSFLLSHPNIKIPEKAEVYSINEGNHELFDTKTKDYIKAVKKEQYKLRYVGSMVADLHRILLKGGIFLYPGDAKNKEGKLRLLFEVNPMAFLIEKAGGKAVSDGKNPLEIIPLTTGHKVPVVLGSKKEVEKYLIFAK